MPVVAEDLELLLELAASDFELSLAALGASFTLDGAAAGGLGGSLLGSCALAGGCF
jgi:hypothetical protein